MRWIFHVLGIDTQSSWAYDFWSGVGAKLLPNPGEVLLALLWFKHHNCHLLRCFRIGKHLIDGSPYCTKHWREITRADVPAAEAA